MSAAPAEATSTPVKKGSGKGKFIFLCLLAIVAGAVVPMVVNVPALLGKNAEVAEADSHGDSHADHGAKSGDSDADHGKAKAKPKAKSSKGSKEHESHTVSIPFGDAVVNLADERMTRYLKLKVIVELEGKEEEKEHLTEFVNKHKPALKTWIISHVAGKSLKDVSGTVGVKRLQREFFEKFEEVLYPDEEDKLKDVLFEEYVVQ